MGRGLAATLRAYPDELADSVLTVGSDFGFSEIVETSDFVSGSKVIRENNRDVEGRPDFEVGFPGYRVPRPDILPCGRPLLSIWFRPQDTIQRVVWHKGEWWILRTRGCGRGGARALTRVSSRASVTGSPLNCSSSRCLILGPVLQLVMIYLGGLILFGFGRMVGGEGELCRGPACGVGMGAWPQAVMLFPLGFLALAFFGPEMFESR